MTGALPAMVNHELHQEHKLSLVNMASWSFNCDVCKQHGEGTAHYRCEPCDFDAHADCATAPATFKHVNYAGDFVLYDAPDSGHPPMYCGLCALEVLGYSYYNRQEDDRLHPSCAFLPRRVVQDGRTFQLGYHLSGTCAMCKNTSTTSLSYRSNYDGGEEVYLHVPCLVDINYRLTGYPNWVASAPIRSGVLGSLTRKKEGCDLITSGTHPEHKLSLVNTNQFQCDVCKRYGKGTTHYRCEPCDFSAHPECATAPATFKHGNYAGDFVLYTGSGSGDPQRYCGLCGHEILGYRYYNREEDCRLHPCCAFLPRHVVQDGRTFDLDYNPSATCGMCRKKSTTSLSYRSTYDDGEEVYLHVQCLVDTNNRLTGYQDWVASAPIMPGVLGSFTRKKEGGDLLTSGTHPEHKLSLVNTNQFQCDACKRYGKGTAHYRCEPCNFDAHLECATAPATFKHVNYAGNFVLYAESGPGDPQRYCGLCGREILGYRYYNRERDCHLHPCCAFLPRRVIQDGRAFDLGYYPSGMCGMCRKKSTLLLSYRSTYDDGKEVYLHVRCLVDTNNRLTGYQDWVASAPIWPGVLRSFTRKKEGSSLMKAASLSFDIARAVLEVASLDIGGIAETAQTVAEAFNSE